MMPKISACVIVKNEEANLPQWLRCVKSLADEWIVVDTGSEDNTVNLAKEAGAKVYSFSWCNDFSAAKNYALSQASGEWIVFLDADEYFSPNDIPKIKVRIKKQHHDKMLAGFICKLINIDKDRHNAMIDTVYQIRIFRNKPYLRFRGKIHEGLFNPTDKNLKMEYFSEVTIYHTGYSHSIIRKKTERNLQLILEEISKRGERPVDCFYLMDCYHGMGNYDKTIYYARKALEANIDIMGVKGHIHERLISALIMQKYPWEDILSVINSAMERYPMAAEFPFLAGIYLFDHKRYVEAEMWLMKGWDIFNKEKADTSVKFMTNHTEAMVPRICLYIGRLLHMQNEYTKELEYYLEGLKRNLYDEMLLRALISTTINLDMEDVIQVLNTMYNKEKDAEFLSKALYKTVRPQLAIFYGHEHNMTAADTYLFAGNIRAAAEQVLHESVCIEQLAIWLSCRLQIPAERESNVNILLSAKARNVYRWYDGEKEDKVNLTLKQLRMIDSIAELKSSLSDNGE